MRKKSHISLASQLLDTFKKEEMIGHKLSFYVGSVLPDCQPSFLTVPHNIHRTFDKVQKMIHFILAECKNQEDLGIGMCMKLGMVTHYLADYFTFPHNKTYDGNLKDHCIYENELKHYLRSYIKSGRAAREIVPTRLLRSREEIEQYILTMHQEYLKRKRSVTEDANYIVRVSLEVIGSIFALLQEQNRAASSFA